MSCDEKVTPGSRIAHLGDIHQHTPHTSDPQSFPFLSGLSGLSWNLGYKPPGEAHLDSQLLKNCDEAAYKPQITTGKYFMSCFFVFFFFFKALPHGTVKVTGKPPFAG